MNIIVRTQFEDYHKWAEAPEEVAFLKNKHRHIFYVEIKCSVNHNDRELEFFMVKKQLDFFIEKGIKTMPEGKSCEMMASKLKQLLEGTYQRPFKVAIFEDNENGVEV